MRRPVVVGDVSKDERYILVNPETRSEMTVPLIYRDKVIGVIDLESPQPNYFNEDHVKSFPPWRRRLPSRLRMRDCTNAWRAVRPGSNAI